MNTIHKYTLETFGPEVTVKMPAGAIVRHAGNQHGNLCLWAEVDTNNPLRDRIFRVVGTGNRLECESGRYLNYRGTAIFSNGDLVLHVFELDDVPF